MKRIPGVLAMLFLLAGPWLAGHGRTDLYEGGRSRDLGARAVRNSSAAAQLLGEFRTTLSDTLFVKTERYLHNGVAYTLHLQEELESVSDVSHADEQTGMIDPSAPEEEHHHTEACEHDHPGEGGGSDTLIPPASRDFRGWIGNLHRMVKPWQDPGAEHHHTGGAELLPWFRLMTLADPHNVRGYAIGAWWLGSLDNAQALVFINEGIDRNPDAFQLHLVRAALHYARGRALTGPDVFHPTAEARPCFLAARDDYRRAADLALQARPAGLKRGEPHPRWPDSMDTDAMAACGMAALTERVYGDPAAALALARQYLSLFPDQPVLQTLLRQSGQ
ncbi:MAG: hypothetical protein U1F77_14115 [Kiritimatiellia bacterium]